MFDRFELLIGDKINNVKGKTVLILGLGGVGSYACESLVRSGVESIIVVDNDIIDITNLNRQLMTNMSNIGMYKVDVWYDRIKSINPNCTINIVKEFIDKSKISMLFNEHIDYVIDACDTIDTKVALIEYCKNNDMEIKFNKRLSA